MGKSLLEQLDDGAAPEVTPAYAPPPLDERAPRRGANKTTSDGTKVILDERHAVEQDAIGDGKRFAPGDYVVEIVRCYSVDGDPEIWLPEEDVGYFIAECDGWEEGGTGDEPPVRASWVNRLRFSGPQQLKAFLAEALDVPAGQYGRITRSICVRVVGPENPLTGVQLRLTVQPPTKSGYMHHVWGRMR